ncbi:unnamed protein product [Sympodiomycopsis kandeliae]
MSGNNPGAAYILRTNANPNLKSFGTLYTFPSSIAATMARFVLSIIPTPTNAGGKDKIGGQELEIGLKEVDIRDASEQLTEEYLCDINPNGTVPSLTIGNDTGSPYSSTPAIADRLIALFPTLAPEPHKEEIRSLIKELHPHNFTSMSFGASGVGVERAVVQRRNLENLLADQGISERHRAALQQKLKLLEAKESGFEPAAVEQQLQMTRDFIAKIVALLHKNAANSPKPTIFGTPVPTALDAQIVPLLVRLSNVEKDDYLGPQDGILRKYLQYHLGTDQGKRAAEGFR